MEKDNLYIKHILDAIALIEGYLDGVDFEKFSNSNLLRDGVIRELEIIGEASKNLSDDFKKGLNSVEWRKIAGIRDKLIHHYFGIDLEVIWGTVKEDLPFLKEKLSK